MSAPKVRYTVRTQEEATKHADLLNKVGDEIATDGFSQAVEKNAGDLKGHLHSLDIVALALKDPECAKNFQEAKVACKEGKCSNENEQRKQKVVGQVLDAIEKHVNDLLRGAPEVEMAFVKTVDKICADSIDFIEDVGGDVAAFVLGVLGEVVDTGNKIVDIAESIWDSIVSKFSDADDEFEDVKEFDGTLVKAVTKNNGQGTKFSNWAKDIHVTVHVTFYPKTRTGVQNIVKYCKEKGLSCRAGGYRHTWGNMYAAKDQVFISMLAYNDVKSDWTPAPPTVNLDGTPLRPDGLQYVHYEGEPFQVPKTQVNITGWSRRCKFGAATTNAQFRDFVVRHWQQNGKDATHTYTIPLNVIMSAITLGGSNAPICHGAGITTKTISDLVTSIEFVNANGEFQTVDAPDAVMKSASGAFGLLGIVTSVTLNLDQLTFAQLNAQKVVAKQAIPPPSVASAAVAVPLLPSQGSIPTEAEIAAHVQDFATLAKDSYYAEWFWFTMQKDVWINCWKNTTNGEGAIDSPSPLEIKNQEFQEFGAQKAVDLMSLFVSPKTVSKFIATLGLIFLPPGPIPGKGNDLVPLCDGLHFRRGINNMFVWDMEFEIPLPRLKTTGEYDWDIVQQAWWDVIEIVAADWKNGQCDMGLTLEMRFTGGSDVTMAPQKGNEATLSIEVLTTTNVTLGNWNNFMQRICDKWAALTDKNTGKPLKLRPHWAKMWTGLKIRGMDVIDYFNNTDNGVYTEEIKTFKTDLAAIAQKGGYSVDDMKARFSNPLLNSIFLL